MELKTKFNINDRVEIIELGRTGEIVEINWNGVRISYSVRYFDDGTPHAVVFYDNELREVKNEKEN